MNRKFLVLTLLVLGNCAHQSERSGAIQQVQCLNGNCLDGWGVARYEKGAQYTGHFRNGLAEGDGTAIFIDGIVFEGKWKANRPDGYGMMTFRDGSYFSGDFLSGFPEGRGFLRILPADVALLGDWKRGEISGEYSVANPKTRSRCGGTITAAGFTAQCPWTMPKSVFFIDRSLDGDGAEH